MIRSLFLALGLVFGGCAFAQDEVAAPPEEHSEVMPEFPGGQEALAKFMVEEVRYPKKAANAGIQGKVYVSFLVDTDGRVKEVGIARGVHPLLDKEAVRVVRRMPRWNPGKIDGKAVTARYQVPVIFRLQD